MKLPGRIASQRKGSADMYQRRRRTASSIALRCHGFCEGCNTRKPLEYAHLFGKGSSAKIAEEFGSSPELGAGLCHDCHRSIDSHVNVDLRDRLRWGGIERLIEAHHLDGDPALMQQVSSAESPLEAIYALDRALRKLVHT